MKYSRLIAFAGAAIIASSSPLIAGASTASAAAVPAATTSTGSCSFNWDYYEGRNSNGAYMEVVLVTDPCNIGVEAAIQAPSGTPASYGGDVHYAGDETTTGYIPINSGNNHGIRWWNGSTWVYQFVD
jgi:hypothetical protein